MGSAPADTEGAETSVAAEGTAAPDATEPAESGGDGLSIAQANIDAFRGIQEFDPLGPAFDASAAAGKTVFTIPSGNIDFHLEILKGIEEAAAATDVEIVDCPNQGTVAEWVECFGQALVLQPDLILLQGSPSPSSSNRRSRRQSRPAFPSSLTTTRAQLSSRRVRCRTLTTPA